MTQTVLPEQDKVVLATGFSPEQISVIKAQVAKNTTNTELAYFLSVCKSADLNPFIKEIWCYKDKKGNLLVFAGRDGFLAKAQREPRYAGIRSSEIRENDKYSLDIPNGIVEHKITESLNKRGGIIGAYAIAFRQDGEPTVEWADFNTYNKGANTWITHPAEMIKKVAEAHALKKAFGISGLQCEYDYNVTNNGVAIPIQTESAEQEKELTLSQEIDKCNTTDEIQALWKKTDPGVRMPLKQKFLDRGYALKSISLPEKFTEMSENPDLLKQSQSLQTVGGKRLLAKDEVGQCLAIIRYGSFADKDGNKTTPLEWFKSITESRVVSQNDYKAIAEALDKYIKSHGEEANIN